MLTWSTLHEAVHAMGMGGGSPLLRRSPESNLRQLHAVLTARASRPSALNLEHLRHLLRSSLTDHPLLFGP
jgi:hypothetical protein